MDFIDRLLENQDLIAEAFAAGAAFYALVQTLLRRLFKREPKEGPQ